MNIVIAGSYAQARNFVREKEWRMFEYVIATKREHVIGLQSVTVWLVGTWRQSHDMRNLFDCARLLRGTKFEYVE